MNEEYLQHHGILGMKWGIRRYQNPDGTLTAEGKRRKSKGKEYSDDYWNAHDKKDLKYMSDKELQQRINRLNNEKQYASLTKSKKQKAAEAAGRGVVNLGKRFVEKAVITAAVAYTAKKVSPHVPEILDAGSEFVKRKVRNSINSFYLL